MMKTTIHVRSSSKADITIPKEAHEFESRARDEYKEHTYILCHALMALSSPALLTLRPGCNVISSTGARRACLYLPDASLISIS